MSDLEGRTMHIHKFAGALAAATVLAGCAHPLVVTPDVAELEAPSKAVPHKTVVGYYISEEQRAMEVITPGGGGDRISYFPYRDMEVGLYKVLGNCFSDVVRLKSANDVTAIGQHNVGYILTPQLKTDSSSPSPLSWLPTQFTVDLSAAITDSVGKPVATKTGQGIGRAEFDEFKMDYALSGKRAMQDALQKFQQLLSDAEELGK
jgi:hypothetical protein